MFRHPMPEAASEDQGSASAQRAAEAGLWLRGCGWVELHSEEFDRQTRCELEADVRVQSLVNPEHVTQSAFTIAGDRTAEQRLVQSLATIWQQSRQDAGSQTQSEFPKLGHIMVTQPGSQSREQVPPTDEELAMQGHVDAMIAREESARPLDTPPVTPSSASSSAAAAEMSPAQSPHISWTPFLAGMMSQSLSQAEGPDLGAATDGTATGTIGMGTTGFSASEVRVSLEGGLGGGNGRSTQQADHGETQDIAEMEVLLDWMRNDDGTNEPIASSAPGVHGAQARRFRYQLLCSRTRV